MHYYLLPTMCMIDFRFIISWTYTPTCDCWILIWFILNSKLLYYIHLLVFVLYDMSESTMCMPIYCDYCVYHYKSTEFLSLYTSGIEL